jgi:hypothetical protein
MREVRKAQTESKSIHIDVDLHLNFIENYLNL